MKCDFLDYGTEKQCVGKHQLAFAEDYDVNIIPKHYAAIKKHNFEVLPLAIELENNGDTLMLRFFYEDPKDIPTISNGPLPDNDKYMLDHAYMNWLQTNPTEFNYEDISFNAELHIVFYNAKYSTYDEALLTHMGLAILAFGFQVNPLFELKELTNVTSYFLDIVTPPKIVELRREHLFSLKLFNSLDWRDFYSYTGSFLTPPECTAGVIWIDFEQRLPITPEQESIFGRNMLNM